MIFTWGTGVGQILCYKSLLKQTKKHEVNIPFICYLEQICLWVYPLKNAQKYTGILILSHCFTIKSWTHRCRYYYCPHRYYYGQYHFWISNNAFWTRLHLSFELLYVCPTFAAIVISDMFDCVSHNFLVINYCLACNFSTDHDHTSLGHCFTSNL